MSATMHAVLIARLALELETAQQHLREADKIAQQLQEDR
jgi:hypothetical protein